MLTDWRDPTQPYRVFHRILHDFERLYLCSTIVYKNKLYMLWMRYLLRFVLQCFKLISRRNQKLIEFVWIHVFYDYLTNYMRDSYHFLKDDSHERLSLFSILRFKLSWLWQKLWHIILSISWFKLDCSCNRKNLGTTIDALILCTVAEKIETFPQTSQKSFPHRHPWGGKSDSSRASR